MRIRLLALALALLPIAAPAQDAAPTTTAAAFQLFGPKSRLVYKLSDGGTLLIAFKNTTSPTGPIKFRYVFSDLGPVGTITMTPEALASATKLHNAFGRGEFTLADATSVWLSQKVFAAAKAGEPVTLDLGDDGKVTFKLDPEGAAILPLAIDYGCIPDGNDTIGGINTFLLKSEDGERFIRVFDNERMPVIVDMATGSFHVRLSLHL
jgi:hypothetical protein